MRRATATYSIQVDSGFGEPQGFCGHVEVKDLEPGMMDHEKNVEVDLEEASCPAKEW